MIVKLVTRCGCSRTIELPFPHYLMNEVKAALRPTSSAAYTPAVEPFRPVEFRRFEWTPEVEDGMAVYREIE